jgi:hypothetical protein
MAVVKGNVYIPTEPAGATGATGATMKTEVKEETEEEEEKTEEPLEVIEQVLLQSKEVEKNRKATETIKEQCTRFFNAIESRDWEVVRFYLDAIELFPDIRHDFSVSHLFCMNPLPPLEILRLAMEKNREEPRLHDLDNALRAYFAGNARYGPLFELLDLFREFRYPFHGHCYAIINLMASKGATDRQCRLATKYGAFYNPKLDRMYSLTHEQKTRLKKLLACGAIKQVPKYRMCVIM